tara:strand:+ start:64 stop:231 length:168 start_codon:yes stop_codon:yes gene_type:complete
MKKEIESPCIQVCVMDPDSGFCFGCGRTMEEIEKWGDKNTKDEWKIKNLEEIKTR